MNITYKQFTPEEQQEDISKSGKPHLRQQNGSCMKRPAQLSLISVLYLIIRFILHQISQTDRFILQR
jgi:hypothetical protein